MSVGAIAASAQRLRDAWTAGAALGIWSSLPDLSVAELLAGLPYDYVCVDLQHGVATFSELPGMTQAMRAAGGAPVVRVPWNEQAGIWRALDSGAAGVLVPMVNDGAEAAAAVAACRFPPAGNRSWGPMWGYVRPDGALPPAEQDASAICLVMIETAAGVDALDEIVRTPGLDGVYVGPNDLALACGYGRRTYRDDAGLEALIQRVVDACRGAGIAAGLHCSDPQMAREWAARGATMLTIAQDTGLLADGARQALAVARGEAAAPEGARPY
ncbi:HpcH/HpaI aldolase family protein [Cellulomonas composti]|uniref:2,4-dihydroxyhept-2-ene-1,7-dioic acid aldolase n=1 Tax=Cellulomonas composti TaxID=266130 RepID=A0A511J9I8_9CELL|nr:aldolase/citrate lyase family protein [Cellulomonas composti]GEL94656.1 2,4-dihydroxyhept-2-ene-1,7-dioic acid aldolase [Cellulomonas composti]